MQLGSRAVVPGVSPPPPPPPPSQTQSQDTYQYSWDPWEPSQSVSWPASSDAWGSVGVSDDRAIDRKKYSAPMPAGDSYRPMSNVGDQDFEATAQKQIAEMLQIFGNIKERLEELGQKLMETQILIDERSKR